MDVIHYRNPGGPDVTAQIEFETETYLYKYSLEVRAKVDNNVVIYRTAGTAKSYEEALAITESLSSWLYNLATAGMEDEK